MKKYNAILILLLTVFTSCDNPTTTENTTNESSSINFESGLIMNEASSDPLGNELNYPTGDPALSSQINVWEPGFNSPWHYHPYTGVAYVIQGELTVNYDTVTSINDTMSEKNIITTQTYKAGEEAFLGVRDTWHLSQNLGNEDLIFLVTWIGEKDKPLAIIEQ
jgi:oxalate decarboxylase/phosphoglucose isomerase-like protein (cupin superfamily)